MSLTIVVLNNYDLARVAREVGCGDKPAHHLFGLDGLRARGWRVEVVPLPAGPAWLRAVQRALLRLHFPVPLGDLGQQWHALRRLRTADVIYAPCQTQTALLGYLRALGLTRTPLVVVAHHPPVGGRLARLRRGWFRAETRGVARFPALSTPVAQAVRTAAAEKCRTPGGDFAPVLPWGPDLAYYDRYRQDTPGAGTMSAGRTGRDWLTLGRAATLAGGAARIFCLRGDLRPEFAAFGPNVRVDAVDRENDRPYPRLLATLAQARVLAVPLAVGPALSGLTSLTDALGLGRPVLLTRNPWLGIDVEREGIGRWVEPGDVAGWVRALQWFDTHPEEAAAMGRRARALAETRWNYRRFTDELAALLTAAAAHAG